MSCIPLPGDTVVKGMGSDLKMACICCITIVLMQLKFVLRGAGILEYLVEYFWFKVELI